MSDPTNDPANDTNETQFLTQDWQRDMAEPCLSLGPKGRFDDTHIFAPCVAYEEGRYWMWYCGSQGEVDDRVFRMGLATSQDGRQFNRHPVAPVFEFGDDRHSILTPTLLRQAGGTVLREEGWLRMWFASTDFPGGDGLHTLHETSSLDGLSWGAPSAPQLEHAYAPTVIKEGGVYRLWYTDVSQDPWSIRYAESETGSAWTITPEPVLVMDQAWEAGRLFYPTVLKYQGRYWMWYGSYHGPEKIRTALGLALSDDGLTWEKVSQNPVFGPDPERSWESHYTTSQSILPLADGSWRIWYATRPAPPFVHKYFAIGTAVIMR